MAVISYLNSFSASNALEILATRPEHEIVRIAGDASAEVNRDILARVHAYQCVGARDEVPDGLRVDASFLAAAPRLLVVSASGSGVDVFDLDACTRAGVLAVNQAGSNAESVAEHAIAMMIALLKNMPEADRCLRRGWRGSRLDFMGRDLFGRTLGIVGLGNVGRRVAEICTLAFKCEVLAYDPHLSQSEVAARHAVQVDFATLLARADIVSVHTPLAAETSGLFDSHAYAAMQPGALFISTARGSIHDESALAAALQSGQIGGAGLDVWANEPPPAAHPLLQFANVVATPHVAGCTADSMANMASYAAHQLLELFDGKPPRRVVNPTALPRYYERYEAEFGAAQG